MLNANTLKYEENTEVFSKFSGDSVVGVVWK